MTTVYVPVNIVDVFVDATNGLVKMFSTPTTCFRWNGRRIKKTHKKHNNFHKRLKLHDSSLWCQSIFSNCSFSGGCYFFRLRLIFSIRRSFLHTSARSLNTNNTTNREISSIFIKHINFRLLITHPLHNPYVCCFFFASLCLYSSRSPLELSGKIATQRTRERWRE